MTNVFTRLLTAILLTTLLMQGLPMTVAAADDDTATELTVSEDEAAPIDNDMEEAPVSETDTVIDEPSPTEVTEPEAPQVTEPEPPAPKAYTALYEHDIPLYFQTDYPNNRYGAGTIKSSGCGVTCLAMVATYMTGHEYLPDELARWFGGRAENNIARMVTGATEMQLPFYRAKNINTATAALMEGKIAIMMMEGYKGQSKFTQSQHFILVRGMTADGKYLVHDPYAPNYDKWDLKEGFKSGFTRHEIVSGYSGAWIFDPDAMPEKPFLYHKKEHPRQINYPGVSLTYEQQELICKVIWVESRGECAEGQQAIAEIILNRLTSGKFGDSLDQVIYGQGQFRSVPGIPKATPWQAQYDALDAALYGKPILDKDVYYFATTPLTSNQWGTIGGHIFCYEETPEEPESTEDRAQTESPALPQGKTQPPS